MMPRSKVASGLILTLVVSLMLSLPAIGAQMPLRVKFEVCVLTQSVKFIKRGKPGDIRATVSKACASSLNAYHNYLLKSGLSARQAKRLAGKVQEAAFVSAADFILAFAN
jgi:hypothetical protein